MNKADGTPNRIVVIDDDRDIVKVIRVMLRVKGAEVLEAYGGIQGLELIKAEHPDLVLLDIMMPDIDGFEVMRRIKEDPATSSIPVIFISSLTGFEHLARGMKAGAKGYIEKPFTPEQLIESVESCL